MRILSITITTMSLSHFITASQMHSSITSVRLGNRSKFGSTYKKNARFQRNTMTVLKFVLSSLPKGKAFAERVVALPKSARKDGVCLRWSFQTASYQCVGLDNVVVTSSTSRASALHADLDTFRPSDWYSYPGGVLSVRFLFKSRWLFVCYMCWFFLVERLP